ncbi:MAG: ABC transporter substrate-binding protein [Roseburia sp.]|nr:ABC transporter substrate-binding protein [Roseburia sp.]
MKNKKIITLLLTACTIIGLFAGCGGKESTEQKSNDTSSQESNGAETDNLFEEEVNLIWVQPTIESVEENLDAIMEEINKITKEKINTTITLKTIPFAEYTDKLQMMYTSGEKWDVTHGGAWNAIPNGVSMGAFAPISREILETYAPEYMTHFDDSVWDAVTFDGQIYACPIEQPWTNTYTLLINEELAEKYNYDFSKITCLDDLDEYLALIKENEPDIQPTLFEMESLGLYCYYLHWDYLGGSYKIPGIIYDNVETPTVVNQFETDEFKDLLTTMRRWYLAGYLPEDAATGGSSADGKDWAVAMDVYIPGRRQLYYSIHGFYVDYQLIGEPSSIMTSKVQEHCQVISADCENIERAVAFINLLNTDEELLNLYLYGIEGTDYEWADEENKVIKPISTHYAYDWLIGNTFNTWPSDPSAVGATDEMRDMNAVAEASPILGFTFDAEPVSTQIAQCTTVSDEYLPGLVTGTVDPDAEYDAFIAALKQAGMDDIIAEMQRQIDEWLLAK